jgi:hypothetical protein
MNLFVTRNRVPQSLPGDLGPLVELRKMDPKLQLIVPAMHFAEHAHMNNRTSFSGTMTWLASSRLSLYCPCAL